VESQLLTMIMQKVRSQRGAGLVVEPRSLAIAKRGDCTFVQKARTVQSGSAQFGIVVNSGMSVMQTNSGMNRSAH